MNGVKKCVLKLLAFMTAAAIMIVAVPLTVFADEAVSFNGEDIEKGDSVYLGEWVGWPVSWDVQRTKEGALDVLTSYIMFDSPMNLESDISLTPGLTLETTDLYTKTTKFGPSGKEYFSLPYFKTYAFDTGEYAVASGAFRLPDIMADSFHDADTYYWISNEDIHERGSDGHWWAQSYYKGGANMYSHIEDVLGVRPSADFDMTDVLFSSAAKGVKSDAAAGEFVTLSDTSSITSWKFTVLDSSRSISASASSDTTVTAGYSSWTVPVTFSGGGTEADDYVSAILCDPDGKAVCYATVAKSTTSGTQNMTMPTGLKAGSYTLKVFSEQRNGENETDYASKFVDIELTVKAVKYTITFANEDGTVLQSSEWESGTMPSYTGETPAKDPDTDHHYHFSGWSPALESVTGDATYTAVYEAKEHTEVIDPAVDPTCTGTGKTEGKHCSECGTVIVAQETAVALGHDWGEWKVITEPEVGKKGVKQRTCKRCGEIESETIPALMGYTITEGADGIWTKDSGADYRITVKRDEADDTCFSHFTGFTIDGITWTNGTDYTAASGSTVITMKSSALQKLTTGSHTITVSFDDGKAETTITINPTVPKTPDTGDSSNTGMWAGLLFLSLISLTGLVIYRRRIAE